MLRKTLCDIEIIRQSISLRYKSHGIVNTVNYVYTSIQNDEQFANLMQEMFLENIPLQMVQTPLSFIREQDEEYKLILISHFVSAYYLIGYMGFNTCINSCINTMVN